MSVCICNSYHFQLNNMAYLDNICNNFFVKKNVFLPSFKPSARGRFNGSCGPSEKCAFKNSLSLEC